jgi:transposase
LLTASVEFGKSIKLLGKSSQCAIDATGLETRHVSKHFVLRAGHKRYWMRKWPKLTAVYDLSTHLALAVDVCVGPCQDSPQFAPAVRQAAQRQKLSLVLGDKGYDSEKNHALCREELKIPRTIIPVRRKSKLSPTRSWPATPYRREMKRTANREGYGQRWQAESAFSGLKRLLGSALRARNWTAQCAEVRLRVLTHNCMILANTR